MANENRLPIGSLKLFPQDLAADVYHKVRNGLGVSLVSIAGSGIAMTAPQSEYTISDCCKQSLRRARRKGSPPSLPAAGEGGDKLIL